MHVHGLHVDSPMPSCSLAWVLTMASCMRVRWFISKKSEQICPLHVSNEPSATNHVRQYRITAEGADLSRIMDIIIHRYNELHVYCLPPWILQTPCNFHVRL